MTQPESDRKTCPHCGHSNRASARVCVECGHPFLLVRATGTLRKRCAKCGYENRLRARVCSQCGEPFRGALPADPAASVVATRQKWCPQCGTARPPDAKVCPQCGYHFRMPQKTEPIVQTPQPAVTLPDDAPPPPVNLPPSIDLDGEPAPYISKEEFNRLRRSGIYQPNLLARLLDELRKKGDS